MPLRSISPPPTADSRGPYTISLWPGGSGVVTLNGSVDYAGSLNFTSGFNST